MTILMLLAIFVALPILVAWAQEEEKPFLFEFPEINPNVKDLVAAQQAVLEKGFVSLTSGGVGVEFCTGLVCMGKAYYRTVARVPAGKGISFSTKFTFSITPSRENETTGDGFVFFIAKHPMFIFGQPNGYFGLFRDNLEAAKENPFFGIEFDTMVNVNLRDQDNNHLGVDINSAVSSQVAKADAVNVKLNDGKKIVAWIDYDKVQNLLEARISYDAPGVLKPTEPLLNYTYDLNYMELSEFWTGFSSSSNFGFEQRHLIHDWVFNATFIASAPALNQTISWARLAAYVVGGTAAVGITWSCIVRFTDFGKRQHARCMKLIPCKRKWFKQKGGGAEVDVGKPIPATASDDDEGDEPWVLPKEDEDEEEVDEDQDQDEEEDDDSDQPLPPPPPPPPGGMFRPPQPKRMHSPPPPPPSKVMHPPTHLAPSKVMHSPPPLPPLKVMHSPPTLPPSKVMHSPPTPPPSKVIHPPQPKAKAKVKHLPPPPPAPPEVMHPPPPKSKPIRKMKQHPPPPPAAS